MQDKYAGDVGDFGKAILLNHLIKASGGKLRLGINWYHVTRPEKANNDGRHIDYTKSSNSNAAKYRACDTVLYHKLKSLIDGKDRSIQSLQNSMGLPKNTIFYSTELPYGSNILSQRVAQRDSWFSDSLKILNQSKIVFLDPDNGIATHRVKKTQTRSIKYALSNEICSYAKSCDIVVVYNHRDHSPHDTYIQRFVDVQRHLGSSMGLRILRFKRVSVRDYAFYYNKRATTVVRSLIDRLLINPYSFLFEELKIS